LLNQRRTKREQIIHFFLDQPEGVRFGTVELHTRFGPSFRSRVSEINRDETAPITIINDTRHKRGVEVSTYHAQRRRIVGEGDLAYAHSA